MTTENMKYFMYKHPYGSLGYQDEAGMYWWVYGRDNTGEMIRNPVDIRPMYPYLVEIPKGLFWEYVSLPAWSDDQKVVRQDILEWLYLTKGVKLW